MILVVLLASAYAFARYLARPLRQLNDAVASVGQGKSPPPLPESGPSEIVNLNRGFNQMLAHGGALGANAVIGVRYDATEVAPGITEVLCYGTAVLVEQQKG